jgi:hypothetical protein
VATTGMLVGRVGCQVARHRLSRASWAMRLLPALRCQQMVACKQLATLYMLYAETEGLPTPVLPNTAATSALDPHKHGEPFCSAFELGGGENGGTHVLRTAPIVRNLQTEPCAGLASCLAPTDLLPPDPRLIIAEVQKNASGNSVPLAQRSCHTHTHCAALQGKSQCRSVVPVAGSGSR